MQFFRSLRIVVAVALCSLLTVVPVQAAEGCANNPDISGNGTVDIFDYSQVLQNYNPDKQVINSKADINCDGYVNIFDYNKVISTFGTSVATPSPGANVRYVFADDQLLYANQSWGSDVSMINNHLTVNIFGTWGGLQLVGPEITNPDAVVFTLTVASDKKAKVGFIVKDSSGQKVVGGEVITLTKGTHRITTGIPDKVSGLIIQDQNTPPHQLEFSEMYFEGGTAPATPVPVPPVVMPPAPTPQPAGAAQLEVDAAVNAGTFSTELLGVQAPQWQHDEHWKKPMLNEVPGLNEVYKYGVGLVRYGGGLEVNNTGWERTPQVNRECIKNEKTGKCEFPVWYPMPQLAGRYSPAYANSVKAANGYFFRYSPAVIDSLGAFNKNTGIPVMLQINVDENDPAMWADLLHYANVEHDYNIKYMELGNEWDLVTYEATESAVKEQYSPERYAQNITSYIDVLKAVDPNIKLIGGVSATAHNGFLDGTSLGGWSQYLLEAAFAKSPTGKRLDSLSYHWYGNGKYQDGIVTVEKMQRMYKTPGDGLWKIQVSRSWSEYAPKHIKDMVIKTLNPNLTLGITEYNFEAVDHYEEPFSSNHLAAVRLADVLGRSAANGLDYNILYQGYSGANEAYSAIALSHDGATGVFTRFLRPTYSTLFMYKNYFGSQLVKATSSNEAEISIWASKKPGSNALYLMVVNMSDQTVDKTITIKNKQLSAAKVYKLTNPNPTARSFEGISANHGTTINGVKLTYETIAADAAKIQPQAPTAITNNSVTVQLPAFSVTAIQLE